MLIKKIISCLCFCCLPTTLLSSQAPELDEFSLKTAYIYNFILLTNWEKNPTDSLEVCLFGHNPFNSKISELNESRVQDKLLSTRSTSDSQALDTCDVIYFGKDKLSVAEQYYNKTPGKQVLTIADSSQEFPPGIAINMRRKESKVVFFINMQTAGKRNITFSSHLLKLAEAVIKP